MTQALVRPQPQASRLALATGMPDDRIELIRQIAAPSADRLELANFLAYAVARGLDPLAKQVYFIRYVAGKPGSIVVGIDGERATADSTGEYAGSDPPEYEYEKLEPAVPKGGPSLARVTAWRIVQGQKVSATGEARWAEEYPGDGEKGAQYRKRPWNQLAVRAESRALRKLFPRQMGALTAPVAVSQEWREAALVDEGQREQFDREMVAYNSRRYAQIFLGDDEDEGDGVVPPPVAPASDIEQADDDMEERIRESEQREVERQRKQEGLI